MPNHGPLTLILVKNKIGWESLVPCVQYDVMTAFIFKFVFLNMPLALSTRDGGQGIIFLPFMNLPETPN
jgi:hypothetical protein